MTKSKLSKETSEFLVTVEVEGEKWENVLEISKKELLSKVQVKGFRKGKVPQDIALKHVSESDIFAHSITKTLDGVAKEASKEIKESLMVLDAPTYKIDSIDKKKVIITFIYPIYPEINLGDYKNMGVKYVEKMKTDELVKGELAKITESAVEPTIKKGAIENGDVAIFDFEGFLDGKPFENGKAEKYSLTIGSQQFVPGFEDQMIGLKAGNEKDIEITFPKDYHSDELKGKLVVFKIKLHEVKAKGKGELKDENVVKLNIPNVKDVKALKTYLKDVFEMQQRQEARAKFQREIFDKILKKTSFVIPAQLLSKEMQGVAKQTMDAIKQQGFSMEKYFEMTGMNKEKLNSQFKLQGEKRLRDALVFAEIAKTEKIKLTEAEYEAEYVKLAKVYNQSIDGIKGSITKQQMQVPMTNDRVVDILIEAHK